jgi:hypothetical protein
MFSNKNTSQDFTDPDFRDQNLVPISPIVGADHFMGDQSPGSSCGSSGFTDDGNTTIAGIFNDDFAATEARESMTQQRRCTSKPTDLAIVEKLTQYIQVLCHKPGENSKDYVEARKHLTQLFNEFVESNGLTDKNQKQCEDYLGEASKEWWAAKNNPHKTLAAQGALPFAGTQNTQEVSASAAQPVSSRPPAWHIRQRLQAQQQGTPAQARSTPEVHIVCGCNIL